MLDRPCRAKNGKIIGLSGAKGIKYIIVKLPGLKEIQKNKEYQETVVYGSLIPYLREQENLMAYFRKGEGQTLLVMGNFQKDSQRVILPGNTKKVLLNNLETWKEENGLAQMEGQGVQQAQSAGRNGNEEGWTQSGTPASAAPATVSGERPPDATGATRAGKAGSRIDPRARRPALQER